MHARARTAATRWLVCCGNQYSVVLPDTRMSMTPSACNTIRRCAGSSAAKPSWAVDLALDHPLDGPAHIMVPGLDRASRDSDPVTIIRKCVGVAFRRDVDDLEIGEMRFRRSNRLLNIALSDTSVVGKGLIFGRRGHP